MVLKNVVAYVHTQATTEKICFQIILIFCLPEKYFLGIEEVAQTSHFASTL